MATLICRPEATLLHPEMTQSYRKPFTRFLNCNLKCQN